MPVPLALPIAGAGGAAAAQTAAWFTAAVGALALKEQALRFQRNSPTGVADPTATGLAILEALRQGQAGGGNGQGSGDQGPGGGNDAYLLALGLIGKAGQEVQNIWQWMNRPRQPDQVNPYPGLKPGQKVKITTSPRATTYTVWTTGWAPVDGTYTYGVRRAQNWPTDLPFPNNTGWKVTGVSATESNFGQLWGRTVCHLECRIFGVTDAGQAGIALYFRQLESGTGDIEVVPNDPDTQGWVTTINTSAPANWKTPLPEREPAKAPPQPLPEILPGTRPKQPGTYPLPPDLEEQLGEDAAKPIWEWPPGVGTGANPGPGTETGTAPATKPMVPVVPTPWQPTLPGITNPQPIGPDGRPVPLPPPPVKVTDPDSHFVGGKEISGAPARADIASIAKELVRVEAKLANLSRPSGAVPGSADWLSDLAALIDLVDRIEDMLTLDVNGLKWSVQAPCNKDADGNPIVWETEIPKADYLPALIMRTEALMSFLGNTAGWRKPVCKIGNPANVTVYAYEIDPTQTNATT